MIKKSNISRMFVFRIQLELNKNKKAKKRILPFEKLVELNAIRKATFAYFAHMHQTAISQLFDDEFVEEHIFLVRIRFDASNEIRFAFVYFLY